MNRESCQDRTNEAKSYDHLVFKPMIGRSSKIVVFGQLPRKSQEK